MSFTTTRARLLAMSALILLAALVSPAIARAEVSFTVTGGGYGHGIGLSQYGAQGYAKQGRSYDWILAHYFQGTTLATKADTTVTVNLDPTANYTSSSSTYNKGYTRSSWRIRAGYAGGSMSIGATTAPLPDRVYTFTASNGTITVTGDDGKVYGRFSGSVTVTPGPGSPPLLQVFEATGNYGNTYVRYRGTMVLYTNASAIKNSNGVATQAADHIKLVNALDIEDYIRGVVPNESPSGWNAEALRAQAVAARSYVYGTSSDLYCTTMSQAYRGHSQATATSRPATMADTDSHMYEKATTNAAVLATDGQVVMSGSTVVQTFFSSSSGGHTANIEDVWLSSTPHTYYTGVDDADSLADSGNPNATWSAGTFTGTAMAGKIRAHGAGDEPSPATVTAISVDRAASGFVRHATITWSNGASHTITGDDFRQSLGLKSNKFYITATPPPLPTARFEESDSRLAWSGTWTRGASSALSGGAMRSSSANSAAFYASFTGTGFVWIGNRAASYGKAQVYVDGALATTVDLYSASTSYKQRVYSRTNLPNTAHVVRIVVTGLKNAASHGYTVAVDAVDITGSGLTQAVIPPARFEETDVRIAYGGAWTAGSSALLSGGAYLVTHQAGARAYVAFTGTAIAWLGCTAPGYGGATIRLDGGAPVKVSCAASSTAYQQVVWSANGLPSSGTHVLEIVADGPTGDPAAGFISIDAFDVTGGAPVAYVPPLVRAQEGSTAISYAGRWTTGSSSRLSGGAQRWASVAGASATLTFEGTSATWIGNRAPTYGMASVYIDGRLVKTVDLYARTAAYGQRLYATAGLRYGTHALRIVVSSKKNASSRGRTVAIDAFDVRGFAPIR